MASTMRIQGAARLLIAETSPKLPFRRIQRCRARRAMTSTGAVPSKMAMMVTRPLSTTAQLNKPQRTSKASSASSSTSKAADKKKAAATPTSADEAKPAATSAAASPSPSSSSPASTSSSSESNASSAPPKGPVRVTDKRSDPTTRQAEIAAREAEKQQQQKLAQAGAASTKLGDQEPLVGTVRSASSGRETPIAQSATTGSVVPDGTASGAGEARTTGAAPSSAASPSNPQPSTSSPQTKSAQTSSTSPASATPSSPSTPQTSQPSSSSSSTSSSQGSSSSSSSSSTTTTSSSELLKQRLQQAQEKLERPLPSMNLGLGSAAAAGATTGPWNVDRDGTIVQQPPAAASGAGAGAGTASHGGAGAGQQQQQQQQQQQSAGSAAASGSGASTSSPPPPRPGPATGVIPSDSPPTLEAADLDPTGPALDHLFDTRAFVRRLEDAGFLNAERVAEAAAAAQGGEGQGETMERRREVLDWLARAQGGETSTASTPPPPPPSQDVGSTFELTPQPPHRPHDPAEAILDLTSSFLHRSSRHTLSLLLDRVAVENQRYLFTAALSELRTELQVRARNDAAALRSITTLLQREVDGLSQRMKEDMETMKHDIAVDMNNRKGEAKEEQNSLEQEIQDLNNRFTISLSDLKTEIEQSIKWDLTRRALALVFGIAAITVITLFAADVLSKRKERERRREEAERVAAAGGSGGAAVAAAVAASGSNGASEGGIFKRRSSAPPPAAQPAAVPTPAAGASGAGMSLRPAEELGLVEQDEADQEARYL